VNWQGVLDLEAERRDGLLYIRAPEANRSCNHHIQSSPQWFVFSLSPQAPLTLQQKFFATLAFIGTAVAATLAPRSGKPTGGPAQGTLTVFSGNTFKCSSINSVIPTDGSAGTFSLLLSLVSR
jgi:hypothetical protein